MDMDRLLARVQAARANFVDANGTYRRNVEERGFHNMLIDWRARGRPESEMPAMKAREADLRKRGKLI